MEHQKQQQLRKRKRQEPDALGESFGKKGARSSHQQGPKSSFSAGIKSWHAAGDSSVRNPLNNDKDTMAPAGANTIDTFETFSGGGHSLTEAATSHQFHPQQHADFSSSYSGMASNSSSNNANLLPQDWSKYSHSSSPALHIQPRASAAADRNSHNRLFHSYDQSELLKTQPNDQASASTSEVSILRYLKGFITPPKGKQPGGKKNRKPLPPQTVQILWNCLTPAKLHELQQQYQHAQANMQSAEKGEEDASPIHGPKIVCYLTRKKEKTGVPFKLIETLSEQPVNPCTLRRVAESSSVAIQDVTFTNLVIQHSSHNHGQALMLLFHLVDSKNNLLGKLPSATFETITRRGIEKQKQKKNIQTRKEQLPACTLVRITPPAAPTSLPVYVKIEGPKIALRAQEHECSVFFGDEKAPSVFLQQSLCSSRSYKSRDTSNSLDELIVSAPVARAEGSCTVSIVFGDGTRSTNTLNFHYYNVAEANGASTFFSHLFREDSSLSSSAQQFSSDFTRASNSTSQNRVSALNQHHTYNESPASTGSNQSSNNENSSAKHTVGNNGMHLSYAYNSPGSSVYNYNPAMVANMGSYVPQQYNHLYPSSMNQPSMNQQSTGNSIANTSPSNKNSLATYMGLLQQQRQANLTKQQQDEFLHFQKAFEEQRNRHSS